jgi:two-component system, NtrC family, sensor kinase
MKPLKLYTRTTILTSAALTVVLLVFVVFFITKIREMELQDQEQTAKLWAAQLANWVAYESQTELLQMRLRAISFSQAHEGQIRQIRIYSHTKNRLIEQISLLPDEPEELTPADIAKLKSNETVSRLREIESDEGSETVIYAAAPIFDENKFQGAVSLTTPRSQFADRSSRIVTLTVALLAFAIVSITALLYLLFSQVLYKPVEDLLKVMYEVKTGNLEIETPVRARDEFGQLAVSFNHMISRLREMTAERAAYQKRLEARVQEATVELAERNTQLEEASAALFEIQRELTKFERLAAAGQMAAQFAHEVGTPLNLISGHVQLLAARTDDQKTRERLDLISSQIERIERIVRSMLDATRRPRPHFETLDLSALLQRIFEITAPTLAAHQVELITRFDTEIPMILGDGEQLQQVFINLINNSLDAMPFGGQLFFTASTNGANASGSASNNAFGANGYVEVKCRDTGEGIEDEIKPRIFDPLFTTKLRGRGSGLGLAVVSQIIREHGGAIEVESDAGQGAEFKIRFPVVEPTGGVRK